MLVIVVLVAVAVVKCGLFNVIAVRCVLSFVGDVGLCLLLVSDCCVLHGVGCRLLFDDC